jgi:hypothetical protein
LRLLFNPISGQFEFYDPVSESAITAERLQKTFIADENISAMKIVYVNIDGHVKVGQTTTENESRAIGISLNAANIGESITIQLFGKLDDAFLSFALNQELFLNNNGTISGINPTTGFLTSVGHCIGTGSIFINIGKPIKLA